MPFPVYQNYRKCQLQDSLKSSYSIQKELFRLADMGELMIQKQHFMQIMESYFPKIKEHVMLDGLLREALEQGVVHKTQRVF